MARTLVNNPDQPGKTWTSGQTQENVLDLTRIKDFPPLKMRFSLTPASGHRSPPSPSRR